MKSIKDTQRANVRFGFDGHVYKRFAGPMAAERFGNETKVLRYLEAKGCSFVPRLVAACDKSLELVMTHCGTEAPMISPERLDALFLSLEREFGVKHDDAFARNVTYNHRTGGFNVIDFEYAVIVETGEGFTISDEESSRSVSGPN